MKFSLPLILGLALLSETANAQDGTCDMKMTFDTPETTAPWQIVNDGVMGGLSKGTVGFDQGVMRFEGNIITRGGGFSSVRAAILPGALADAEGLKLRVRSDGRVYKVSLRTDLYNGYRPVSFQGAFPALTPGQWTEVTIPFDQLRASVHGNPVRRAVFDTSAVREIGIILADGRDGPFQLDVEMMASCSDLGRA